MKMSTVLHETCEQYVARRLSEGWRVAGRYKHLVFLSPPDGSFIRPIDLRNDIETLRPNAPGDETGVDFQYPDADYHWDKVDEEMADGFDSYVWTDSSGFKNDLYNLPNHTGSGTINFVKVCVRCICDIDAQVATYIKTGDTVYLGTTTYATVTWKSFTTQYNTNPKTEEAWTWDEIDALQIGIKMRRISYGGNVYCTQAYVEVDYTPPTPAWKDIATRFKLTIKAYKDTSTRFKLWARSYKDIATRFRLRVQGFTDAATRFVLNALNYQDVATRFKLFVQGYSNVAARFKLLPQAYQDVSTRFLLYQPSWKSLQILGDIAALEAKVAGLKREPKAHFEI